MSAQAKLLGDEWGWEGDEADCSRCCLCSSSAGRYDIREPFCGLNGIGDMEVVVAGWLCIVGYVDGNVQGNVFACLGGRGGGYALCHYAAAEAMGSRLG